MSDRGTERRETDTAGRAEEEDARGARQPIFLRTVYPLNPGIPHYLDFPQRAE